MPWVLQEATERNAMHFEDLWARAAAFLAAERAREATEQVSGRRVRGRCAPARRHAPLCLDTHRGFYVPSHRVLLLFIPASVGYVCLRGGAAQSGQLLGAGEVSPPPLLPPLTPIRLNLVPHFILFLCTLSSLYGFPAGPAPLENRARRGAAQAHFHIQDGGAPPHDGARAAHAAVPGGTGV